MVLWAVLPFVARTVSKLYREGLEIHLKLGDAIKDVAFSCFIAFEANDWNRLRYFTELGKKLTLAFILVSYPDIMITNFYDSLRTNRYIYNLFKSHPYTAELLRQYELRNGVLEEPKDVREYYRNIAGDNAFLKMWNTLIDIAENVKDFFVKWGEVLISLLHTKKENIFAFADYIISEYAKKAESVKLYNTPADVAEYYLSYAPYIIPTIGAYATIFGVYEDVLKSYSTMECDRGIFLKMPVPLIVDNKLIALGRPQSDFTIIWDLKNKFMFSNLPSSLENARFDTILVKTQYGDYVAISCLDVLEWVYLFRRVAKKEMYYDEDNNILYINIDVKDFLKRMGVNTENWSPDDGVYVCINGDCYYYEPKDWIYILNRIAKDNIKTAYVNPYNGVVTFLTKGMPIGGTPTEYTPTGLWEIGETDLTKVPLAFFYNLAGFWLKWATCISTNRMQVLRYRARHYKVQVNPYYSYEGVEFSVEFTDPIINPPAPILAGIRMFELSIQGMYIAVFNYIPIKCEGNQPKEAEVPFIKLHFMGKKLHDLSFSDLQSYVCFEGENRGMGFFLKSKWYWEWDFGTTMDTFRDLFNLVKSKGIWSYECG